MNAMINNTEPRHRFISTGKGEPVHLVPGVNEVPMAQYALIRGNKQFQRECELRSFVVEVEDANFKKLATDTAVDLVYKTYDLDLLKDWARTESRGLVA